jgi:carboxyl-terminal processing protease
MFIEKGRIVSTAGRNAPERVWEAKEAGTYSGFPIAVLVNKYSASASEIVSACLQDHQRAVVIGERTWGKGSVQNIINLEEGKSALKLTTAGYLRPNGKNIHRAEGAGPDAEWGVKPNDGYEVKNNDAENTAYLRYRRDRDILRKEVKEPAEGDPAFVDKQLKTALDYLGKTLAEKDAKDAAEKAEKKEPAAEVKG